MLTPYRLGALSRPPGHLQAMPLFPPAGRFVLQCHVTQIPAFRQAVSIRRDSVLATASQECICWLPHAVPANAGVG